MTPVFYFGCIDSCGHYLFSPVRGKLPPREVPGPWKLGHLDGGLAPEYSQKQHRCTLTQKDGWTAMAFWDYTVDHRGKSNSVFFTEGELTFEELFERAKASWTSIFHRFPDLTLADK